MARAPAAAPVAVEEEMPAADMAMADDMAVEEEAAESTVVATILKNADGSYTLETGAGPEEMAEMPMGMGAGAPAPMAAGKTYQADEAGIGELMTAVLDLVDPENAGSPQAAANFAEGFRGPPADAPAA